MSSTIVASSAVIFLLCLASLSTSIRASRVIAHNHELSENTTSQDPVKNIEKAKEEERERTSSQVNETERGDEHGVKLMNTERRFEPKDQDQGLGLSKQVVINVKGRRRHSRSENSGKFPKVVTWSVPKIQDEVPQTGFTLDYAPPKVHPPTHN